MKKLHSILLIMVVMILLCLSPINSAEAAEGKPGQTVSVTFSFNEIRGMDGVFSFSNEAILENISYSSTFAGMRFNNNRLFYSTTEALAKAGTVTVTATIKADAPVGSSCTITLGDINITDADTNAVYSGSKSEAVNVVKEPVVTKAPVNPTATPASQSGGQSQNNTQSSGQNQQGNGSQNNQSINNNQTIEVTNNPQANSNSNSNEKEDNTSIEATRTATASPSESVGEDVSASETPIDSYEVNAAPKKVKQESDKSSGNSIWLILLVISIIVNLILAGILIWRKILKNADTGKDTPLVDYDINEDDEPLNMDDSE